MKDTFIFISILVIIFVIIVGIYFYSSCRQAEVINDKNGTDYSCGDVFWAKEQINTDVQTIKIEGLDNSK